ncbi:tetratricopeptide repeat protein [Desulfocicer vacuolatum]|uniref:tetratricopeptide repeat protein n=1 Tax=Desulfocicer vacuolatum TaxID=2298 RepID=UPI001BAF9454|nr:tetratricopeptide repeat protein [Desulfocicer vacuolatum]
MTDNFHIKEGITLKNFQWAFTAVYAKNWHPLTWLSHMIDIQIFGMNPFGHHLTNLIFHLFNSFLLFLILQRMSDFYWKSLIVMALFALHPMHVESVAWISERKDVLSTFFWMLAIWSYTYYVKKTSIKLYLPVCACFILSLLAKPMAVTFPFVLLLLDHWPLGRWKKTSVKTHNCKILQHPLHILILEKIPLFLISVTSCAITFYAQNKGGALGSFELYSLKTRVANAIISYTRYIFKMLYPFDFGILYPHPGMPQLHFLIIASLFLILMTGLSILTFRRCPWMFTGWFWYLGILFPVIGIAQVGAQGMADRYTYTPMIGIYILVVWAIEHLFYTKKLSKKTMSSLSGLLVPILVVALSILTFHQSRYWKDSATLFQHTIDITNNNYIAHNNLANAMMKNGQIKKAIFHYSEALLIKPDYSLALGNIGIAFAKLGRTDDALKSYLKALAIDPENEEILTNMGNVFSNSENKENAIDYYEKAIFYNPDYVKAHINLGNLLMKSGDLDKAKSHYVKVLNINLDHKEIAHNQIGNLLAKTGDLDSAINHYLLALKITPDYKDAHNNIGVAFARKGNLNKAVSHFKKALGITPGDPDIEKNLNKALGLLKNNKINGD